MSIRRKYNLPKTIAVDVDGTLVRIDGLNEQLVKKLKAFKKQGFRLLLWSMRGADYCQDVIKANRLEGLFDVVTGKPGYIADDAGWNWTRRTRAIMIDD